MRLSKLQGRQNKTLQTLWGAKHINPLKLMTSLGEQKLSQRGEGVRRGVRRGGGGGGGYRSNMAEYPSLRTTLHFLNVVSGHVYALSTLYQ